MADLEIILKSILPERKRSIADLRIKGKQISELVNGRFLDPGEKIFFRDVSFPAEQIPGGEGQDNISFPEILIKYCGLDRNIDISDLLFIDTETTGLAGGTGTFAFMIGTGHFEPEKFTVHQYFLTDLSAESLLIGYLEKEIGNFRGFVSFNGKSYDIPLLQTRFIINHSDFRLSSLDHIDLLHLSRRIWGSKLESCSLQNLEKFVLRENRDHSQDIPANMIPQVYFHYLDNGDATEIIPILYHNRYDIVSMVSLLKKITAILENPAQEIASEVAELSRIAKLYEDCREDITAQNLYEAVLTERSEHSFSRKRLSFLYKKNGQIDKACECWQQAVTEDELYACEELAKFEEHVKMNIAKALEWTLKGIEILNKSCFLDHKKLMELTNRRDRLSGKLNRNG